MKSFRQAILLATGLLVGVIASWCVAGRLYSNWFTSFARAATLPSLLDGYRALQALRSGDTNAAIELLESRLDPEIVALSALAREETDTKKRAAYLRALTRVRDYRIAHPRKTESPEIDRGVADALASIDEPARK